MRGATVADVDNQADELVWVIDPADVQTFRDGAAVTPAAELWLGCGVADDANKIIRTFPQSKTLRCGNDSFGYRHIVASHLSDWEALTFMTNQHWRDVADEAIEAALLLPEVVTENPGNDTECYSRTIFLYNLNTGEQVGSTIVRVVAGVRSQNVVTAFPPGSHCA